MKFIPDRFWRIFIFVQTIKHTKYRISFVVYYVPTKPLRALFQFFKFGAFYESRKNIRLLLSTHGEMMHY